MGRKILVAIELDDQSANEVLKKVASLAGEQDDVHVVHVVEPNNIAYAVDPTMTNAIYKHNYETAMAHAGQRLRQLCEPFSVAPLKCHVRYGQVAYEIHQLLLEDEFDLLMIGSHGWSGWRRILGSKAASILHGVPVDTWIFKVSDAASGTIGES